MKIRDPKLVYVGSLQDLAKVLDGPNNPPEERDEDELPRTGLKLPKNCLFDNPEKL